MDDAIKLIQADGEVLLVQTRIDASRDTYISATRNINKHVYVQVGKRRDLTLILHPHAARRLIANIEAVLAGDDWAS